MAARKASPLVIGLSNDNTEFFVGSDATPLVEYTRKVIYLEDEQIADINIGKDIEITNFDETSADITIKDVDLDKGSGDRYMNHLYTIEKWHVQQESIQIAESITLY